MCSTITVFLWISCKYFIRVISSWRAFFRPNVVVTAQYWTAGVYGSGEGERQRTGILSSCGKTVSHVTTILPAVVPAAWNHTLRLMKLGVRSRHTVHAAIVRLCPGRKDDGEPGAGGIQEANQLHRWAEKKEPESHSKCLFSHSHLSFPLIVQD